MKLGMTGKLVIPALFSILILTGFVILASELIVPAEAAPGDYIVSSTDTSRPAT